MRSRIRVCFYEIGVHRMEEKLQSLLRSVPPRDEAAVRAARKRLDGLCKPPGSLGRLEDIAAALAGITGRVENTFPKKAVVIAAADNGVTEEGVASADPAFTRTQTLNFIRGVTGVGVLARRAGADLIVADVGIDGPPCPPPVLDCIVARGTRNFCREPAMTREEALSALFAGAALARTAKERGYSALGAGEMGIGNTTTSAAVLSVLTGCDPEDVTGRGAGLSEEAYRRKIEVIRRGIALHAPDPADPVDVVRTLGGFDIAALAGLYIGAASLRLPIVSDGFISTTAALVAVRLAPAVRDYIIPSHKSAEPGFSRLAEAAGLRPMLDLDMRLGEGSGCPLAFFLMDCACDLISRMATLEEAAVGERYLSAIEDFGKTEDL